MALLGTNPLMQLLGQEQMQKAEDQALSMGALNAIGQLLALSGAQPRRVGTGQAIGQALLGGVGGYQASMDKTLQDMLRATQVQEMLDKQTREKRFREQIGSAYTTRPVGTGLTSTGQGSQAQMLAEQIKEFGDEGAASTIGALQSNVNLPQSRGLDQGRFMSALAEYNPLEYAKMTMTGEKAPEVIRTFESFSKMSPEQQKQFLAFKASGTPQTNINLGGNKLTPGQESIDKKFADDYVSWKSGGGQDMTSQIAQLKPVIQALESGKSITGIQVAVQPDLLLAITNPKALQSREQVEEVVQRNLRAVLGAQFTEKEGERLISRAYNPKLAPEENAKRVRKLFLQMSTAAEQKQAMVDYFDQNGTLRGFSGKMPSVQDFYKAMEGETPTLTLQEEAKAILEKRKKP
jgi:hypothetical protein